MTRFELTRLPVRIGGDRHPRWEVAAAYFDWDRGMLALLQLHAGWSWPLVRYGPGVEIEDRGLWVAKANLIRRDGRDECRWARANDWADRPVVDATGQVLGLVRDVEFSCDTGEIGAVLISRGVLADLWDGMWLADFRALVAHGDRISFGCGGHAPH